MKRGLSLAEILLTLGLLSVGLAILATLFRVAARSILHSEQKDAQVRGVIAAHQQLRQDLESALNITTPAVGVTSGTVQLVRLTPYEHNFGLPLLASNQPWAPHPEDRQWTVRYQLAAGGLRREVQPQAGTTWHSDLAQGVTALNCTLLTNGDGVPVSAQVVLETGAGTLGRRLVNEFPLHLPRRVVP